MSRRWWVLGGIAVVAVLAVVAGPWVYGTWIAEDDAPAASVSTSGAQPATGEVNGRWVVDAGLPPNETAAGYTVHEILNGASVTVVGSTGEVSGSATVEAEKLTAGEITVQVASIATDDPRRDGQFDTRVMSTGEFPTATFVVDGPVDLSGLPRDGTTGTVTATGTLTIKGVARPVTVDVEVLRSGDSLVASGSIPVTWTDFGVQPPSLGFVTVDGSGTVDFLVSLRRA
ncbi:YceI family protein [Rhodococcus maanshanensis]|uniref:Polyisoprenoid-binding protein YceI n=1 Tax=Rhodococcus maanshanensis TaxID=183556 RepID=A0A1H7IB04_9NOCA|nr:YceI family protein [Rhodococcus maanshanensis]SEK59686.1 Polyisoprenoid-binding protein YceI [Rhodococcus maanshanensis]